ncbi:MAG: flagellar basal body P-ring formation chaperone FlgA [Planctomycetota bacterium]
MTSSRNLLVAWLLLMMTCEFTQAQVVIQLRSSATVSTSAVRIEDVAELSGGDARVRGVMARLDLESFDRNDQCIVTSNQLATRLLLAGFKRSEFQTLGARQSQVTRTSPLRIRERLTEKISETLAAQFAVPAKQVLVTIESENQWLGMQTLFSDKQYEIRLPPMTELPTGRKRLSVRLERSGRAPITVPLDVTIRYVTRVAVATTPIPRGATVDASMIRILDRALDGRTEYANPDAIIGRVVSRTVPANSVLLANQLKTITAQSQIAVRRNDLIDVVMKIGGGEIRLKNAKAMESGAIGDTIEVLNPNSNRRINASVVGPNLATLPNPARMTR